MKQKKLKKTKPKKLKTPKPVPVPDKNDNDNDNNDKKPDLSAKLSLLDEVTSLCAQQTKLKAARTTAGNLITQREAELASARRGLARRQSKALIDGGDLDGDSAESKTFVTATAPVSFMQPQTGPLLIAEGAHQCA